MYIIYNPYPPEWTNPVYRLCNPDSSENTTKPLSNPEIDKEN